MKKSLFKVIAASIVLASSLPATAQVQKSLTVKSQPTVSQVKKIEDGVTIANSTFRGTAKFKYATVPYRIEVESPKPYSNKELNVLKTAIDNSINVAAMHYDLPYYFHNEKGHLKMNKTNCKDHKLRDMRFEGYFRSQLEVKMASFTPLIDTPSRLQVYMTGPTSKDLAKYEAVCQK